MLEDNKPVKVLIFYHKLEDCFLIRLIDKEYNDLIKYDNLPAFCKLSDFHVDVIYVQKYEVKQNTAEMLEILVNDKYLFSKTKEGTVIIKNVSLDDEVSLASLKNLFNIEL